MNVWVFLYRLAWAALAVMLVVGMAAVMLPQVREYRALREKEAALQEDIRLQEEMIGVLRDRQDRLQSDPAFVEKIAREELGLAKPGETVFKFADDDVQTAP